MYTKYLEREEMRRKWDDDIHFDSWSDSWLSTDSWYSDSEDFDVEFDWAMFRESTTQLINTAKKRG